MIWGLASSGCIETTMAGRKKIKDTGDTARKISIDEIAKGLGASEVRDQNGRIIWEK